MSGTDYKNPNHNIQKQMAGKMNNMVFEDNEKWLIKLLKDLF